MEPNALKQGVSWSTLNRASPPLTPAIAFLRADWKVLSNEAALGTPPEVEVEAGKASLSTMR